MRISTSANAHSLFPMQTVLKPTLRSLDFAPGWELDPVPLNLWASIWSPIVDLRVTHPRDEDGANYMLGIDRGTLAGARYATGYQLFQHPKRKLSSGAGLIAVQRVISGYTAMEFELKTFVHRPGFITITDHLHEFRGSDHRTVGEMILIPRHLLGLPDHSPIGPIMIPIDSLYGETIASEMGHFFEPVSHDRSMDAFDEDSLLHAIGAVIGHHRHPSSERAGWWRARNDLIRKYIDSHLGDQTLLPAQICNLFNLSRATLYRMFEDDGGVRRFIQDRRLYSAIWDLAEGGTQRGRLTRVSEKWGFSSNANFNRAVKAAFGMPPGALLSLSAYVRAARLDDTRGKDPLYDWFSKLGREDSFSQSIKPY